MLDTQLGKVAYKDTVKAYGHEPTWDEFKAVVSRRGDLSVNNTVAGRYIQSKLIPRKYFLIYGAILPPLSLIVVPGIIVAWAVTSMSAWWILAGLVVALILMTLIRKGQRTALVEAAQQSEEAYTHLLREGAFHFGPA